ncbi:MAG TPA: DUF3054 domain-containing protein [Streptosporangiaceae bacterium]|nr:DUF3054 domain-containing protein [Streptosporangiaceae bacterium]
MRSIRNSPALALALDPCLVLAFVLIGRASHHAGGGLAGLASTAWPFLAGTAVGEVLTRSWRRPTALIPVGVGVWLSTVGIGMALRVAAGQGTAAAFFAVALAFLGLFLLGWRVLAAVLRRAAAPAGSGGPAA